MMRQAGVVPETVLDGVGSLLVTHLVCHFGCSVLHRPMDTVAGRVCASLLLLGPSRFPLVWLRQACHLSSGSSERESLGEWRQP